MGFETKMKMLRGSGEEAAKAIRDSFPAFVGDVRTDLEDVLSGIEGIDAKELLAKPFNQWPKYVQDVAEKYLHHHCC